MPLCDECHVVLTEDTDAPACGTHHLCTACYGYTTCTACMDVLGDINEDHQQDLYNDATREDR